MSLPFLRRALPRVFGLIVSPLYIFAREVEVRPMSLLPLCLFVCCLLIEWYDDLGSTDANVLA